MVDVDEEDIPVVKPGQPVLITTDAFFRAGIPRHGFRYHAEGDAVTRAVIELQVICQPAYRF